MPEVVIRIKRRRQTIQPQRQQSQRSAAHRQQPYCLRSVLARPSGQQNKSCQRAPQTPARSTETSEIATPVAYQKYARHRYNVSMGHGRNRGRQVVQISGDINEIVIPATVAKKIFQIRKALPPLAARDPNKLPAIQQTTPINIIETPIVFKISTRNKSVHGAPPPPSNHSCTRNSNPSPRISAPRKIVVRAITFADAPRSRILSVINAKEIPARNKNSGAGKVPPSCDHQKNLECRAGSPSHAS